jgi:arginine decarboxylase
VEFSDFYNVLALISLGNDEESARKLLSALKEISNRFMEKEKKFLAKLLKFQQFHKLS